MRRKMALLLALVMVVTTFVSVPFVSYGADYLTLIDADKIWAEETPFTVYAPVQTSEEGVITATATYLYRPKWNVEVNFKAGEKPENADGEGTITVMGGITEVSKTNDFYKLKGNTTYLITLRYTLAPLAETEDLPTVAKIVMIAYSNTHANTLEIDKPLDIVTDGDEELWYAINTNTKGVLFSLDKTGQQESDYAVGIYNSAKNCVGEVVWDDDEGKYLDCPLILNPGTYYVKVFPQNNTGSNASLTLSASRIAAEGTDVKISTNNTLDINGNDNKLNLYSFQNTKTNYWYKLNVGAATSQNRIYEFKFEFGEENAKDFGFVLYEGASLNNELLDEYVIVEENNTFYANLNAASEYFVQLRPDADVIQTDVVLRIKSHTCDPESTYILRAGDDGIITHGCICNSEASQEYSCSIDADATKIPNITYTGEALAVEPIFAYNYSDPFGIQPKLNPACYTLTYKNSKGKTIKTIKKVGTYTVTIKFLADPDSQDSLKGLKKITKKVKVVPEGTTIDEIVPRSKAFTVKWKKQGKDLTSGYQIQYNTIDKSSGAKKVTITKNTIVSKKITGLKAATAYCARIRSFKTVNGTKYYSSWSDWVEVTTK